MTLAADLRARAEEARRLAADPRTTDRIYSHGNVGARTGPGRQGPHRLLQEVGMSIIRVLNLGAGVQSSAILLMACAGELPRPDVAIFADTGEEPASVYAWLAQTLRPAAERAGIPIEVVSAHSKSTQDRPTKLGDIPAYVVGKDGKGAPIRRQCTRDWKIDPLDRRVKELLGLRRGQHWPTGLAVESWFGISGDEIQRMKHAVEPWRRYWHPLIETPWGESGKRPAWRDPPLRRSDCLAWMRANGFGEAPRSACTFCPFHSDKEWRRLQENEPEAFAHAVAADAMLRSHPRRHTGAMFVHRSLRPLGEIDFTRQRSLDLGGGDFDDECSGVCGV